MKAWHLHYNQEDVWFIPPDSKLVVGLVDCRKGSPTVHDTMRFVLGGGRARLLLIPRGVAHGVANMTSKVGRIIYYTNQHYNPKDEYRLEFTGALQKASKLTARPKTHHRYRQSHRKGAGAGAPRLKRSLNGRKVVLKCASLHAVLERF